MLDFLDHVRWDQTYDFLASGSPPIIVRLMLLNALFLAIYAVRRSAGARPMPMAMALFVQCSVLGANMLILYQTEVEAYIREMMYRF
jgi:hypothetical protein